MVNSLAFFHAAWKGGFIYIFNKALAFSEVLLPFALIAHIWFFIDTSRA